MTNNHWTTFPDGDLVRAVFAGDLGVDQVYPHQERFPVQQNGQVIQILQAPHA